MDTTQQERPNTGVLAGIGEEAVAHIRGLYGEEIFATAVSALESAYEGVDARISAGVIDTMCQVCSYRGEDRESRVQARFAHYSRHPSARLLARAVLIATGVSVLTLGG